MGRNQVEMFTSLDGLVSEDHPYRRFEAVVDLAVLSGPLVALYSDRGRPEPGAERAFRMLVLQGTSIFDLFCVFFVLWFEGRVIPLILKPVVPRLS